MPVAAVAHRLHVVARGTGFEASGVLRERDEVLDTSDWRNVRPLVDLRRLVPAPSDNIDDYIECDCNRHWLTVDAALTHNCPARMLAEVE